jgi:hypothetical protein
MLMSLHVHGKVSCLSRHGRANHRPVVPSPRLTKVCQQSCHELSAQLPSIVVAVVAAV